MSFEKNMKKEKKMKNKTTESVRGEYEESTRRMSYPPLLNQLPPSFCMTTDADSEISKLMN